MARLCFAHICVTDSEGVKVVLFDSIETMNLTDRPKTYKLKNQFLD